MRPFIRQEDVELRLHNTVCMYKNKPVFVTVSRDWDVNNVHIVPLSKALDNSVKRVVVNIGSDDFVALVPELGYINFLKNATSLKRVSGRVQKQGLSTDCVGYRPGDSLDGFPRNSWFFSKAMEDVLENVYPTQSSAFSSTMAEEGSSYAFHKHIAFSNKKHVINLEYRGRAVGFYDANRERFFLFDTLKDRSFLEQILNNHGVKV